MGGLALSCTAEIYRQTHEKNCIIYETKPFKSLGTIVGDVYSIFKCIHLEKVFHHFSNLHQNIKFTIEEETSGELSFLDPFLKRDFCIGI